MGTTQQRHAALCVQMSSRPVIVIYGQRAIDNRAAIHFLKREWRKLSKAIDSVDQKLIGVWNLYSPVTDLPGRTGVDGYLCCPAPARITIHPAWHFRCCPVIWHACRCEIPSRAWSISTAKRRRDGLTRLQ